MPNNASIFVAGGTGSFGKHHEFKRDKSPRLCPAERIASTPLAKNGAKSR